MSPHGPGRPTIASMSWIPGGGRLLFFADLRPDHIDRALVEGEPHIVALLVYDGQSSSSDFWVLELDESGKVVDDWDFSDVFEARGYLDQVAAGVEWEELPPVRREAVAFIKARLGVPRGA